MTRQSIAVLGFVLALASGGTAAAQEEPQRGKVSVFLRGGAGNYTGDFGENINVGPTWGLTLNLQPLRFLGSERRLESVVRRRAPPTRIPVEVLCGRREVVAVHERLA